MSTLPHLGFQRFQPCPRLRPFISCYWSIFKPAGPAPLVTEFMHPEGGSGVFFNFADPLTFDGGQYLSHCLVNGPTKHSTKLELAGNVDALGIRFWPGAGRAFFRCPLSDMLGQLLTPRDLSLAILGDDLVEKLAALPTTAERIALLEASLLQYLAASGLGESTEPRIQHAVNWIDKHRGQADIHSLMAELDVSQRQLERLFQQNLGLSPKYYSILQRTSFARDLLRHDTDQSLTDIGYHAGFYDQAHFIREFKQVIGITPGQYRSKALLRR
ncbi:AraC family transcriptional regulator [Shewanella cyperi]|uniref:AraC family transcriptional regulator n=1 Tax=Shewanella cyperi TaxID=2814292 RepID=A0A974XLS3_9GAMM|nr:AraC family transcriptional regulator [Shewanella cyperi]QSX30741.1 AraC family transcriptional regulator [Shewanella cyperi]